MPLKKEFKKSRAMCHCREESNQHQSKNNKLTKSYTTTLLYTHLQGTKKTHYIYSQCVPVEERQRIKIPALPGESSVNVTAERYETILAARIMCPRNFAPEKQCYILSEDVL